MDSKENMRLQFFVLGLDKLSVWNFLVVLLSLPCSSAEEQGGHFPTPKKTVTLQDAHMICVTQSVKVSY